MRAVRVLATIVGVLPLALHAATVEVPVSLDYRIVEEALAQQVFTGPEHTAEVFSDASGCNALILSNPRVSGGEGERLVLVTDMRASVGTPMLGKCRFAKTWDGVVETVQTAEVSSGRSAVAFRVVESKLLRAEEGASVLPDFMQGWINDYVHPRLSAVTVDLAPAVNGIDELLGMTLSGHQGSAALTGVRTSPEALIATLTLNVPDALPGWAPGQQPPLSDAELTAWDANWQAWDAFATWTIITLASDAGAELTRALGDTLLEARYDLREALESNDRARDPVRDLFLKTWARLAPLLHDADLPVPGGQALRFAGFISAGDALVTLDRLAPHLGLTLNRDALRSFARLLSPGVSDDDLGYDTGVDPELRTLLGFGPVLAATPIPGDGGGAIRRLIGWAVDALVTGAYAASIDPRLVKRLNTWIPRRPEIDNYLQTMARLLDAISDAEHEQAKVPAEYFEIYDPLLRATAWQESCWRQYVERNGAIETIRSSAGSVGLMQINLYVWRGVYDADLVLTDVGYNARAGNEILVHYLVDYAIRRNEHGITGDDDNLARAAYAMYNGGPRHIKRYRDAKTSSSLKKIDGAFWSKYQAIQEQGALAVRPCLAGG